MNQKYICICLTTDMKTKTNVRYCLCYKTNDNCMMRIYRAVSPATRMIYKRRATSTKHSTSVETRRVALNTIRSYCHNT